MSTCKHLASSVMSVSSHLAWCIEALGSKSVMQESANKHGCMQLACHCLAVSQLTAFRGGQGCIPTCRNLNQTCMVLAIMYIHIYTTTNRQTLVAHGYNMYIYTYICIYAYGHIYTCIYTHVHLNIYTYLQIYIYTYIHTYIYTFVHIYICAYIHIYIYVYLYIHIYI